MKDEFAILRVAILLAAGGFVLALIAHGLHDARDQRERMRVDHVNRLRNFAATNSHLAQTPADCPAVHVQAVPGVEVEGSVASPEPGSKPAAALVPDLH